jgi:hypothetical protein
VGAVVSGNAFFAAPCSRFTFRFHLASLCVCQDFAPSAFLI